MPTRAVGCARRCRRRTRRRSQTVSIDLAMAAGRRRRRRRAQSHLVRQPGRAPRQADLRHPARGDGPQPGAAAPMEGRAAGWRIRGLELVRADRRWRPPTTSSPCLDEHRGDLMACYPAIDPDRVSVIYNGIDAEQYQPDPATDVLERPGIDPARRRSCSSGGSPARRASPICWTPPPAIDPEAQIVLCAGAPGHTRDRRRDRGNGRPRAGRARQRGVGARHAAQG